MPKVFTQYHAIEDSYKDKVETALKKAESEDKIPQEAAEIMFDFFAVALHEYNRGLSFKNKDLCLKALECNNALMHFFNNAIVEMVHGDKFSCRLRDEHGFLAEYYKDVHKAYTKWKEKHKGQEVLPQRSSSSAGARTDSTSSSSGQVTNTSGTGSGSQMSNSVPLSIKDPALEFWDSEYGSGNEIGNADLGTKSDVLLKLNPRIRSNTIGVIPHHTSLDNSAAAAAPPPPPAGSYLWLFEKQERERLLKEDKNKKLKQ